MAQSIPGVDGDTGRIEQIVLELERLQKDADGIVNTYVDYVAARSGNSFTATKAAIIFSAWFSNQFSSRLTAHSQRTLKSLRMGASITDPRQLLRRGLPRR
jgi:hypothetical protein